jgi:hypothetical protein
VYACDIQPINRTEYDSSASRNGSGSKRKRAGRNRDTFCTRELLQRLEHMPSGDVVSPASLASESCWDPIRKDPRFGEVVAEYASSATRRPDLMTQWLRRNVGSGNGSA